MRVPRSTGAFSPVAQLVGVRKASPTVDINEEMCVSPFAEEKPPLLARSWGWRGTSSTDPLRSDVNGGGGDALSRRGHYCCHVCFRIARREGEWGSVETRRARNLGSHMHADIISAPAFGRAPNMEADIGAMWRARDGSRVVSGCGTSSVCAETTVSVFRRSGTARSCCLLNGRQRLAEQCEFSFVSRVVPSPVTDRRSDVYIWLLRESVRPTRAATSKASRGWQQRRHRSAVPYRRPGRRESCAITSWPSARRRPLPAPSCCAALISAVTSAFDRSAEEATVGALLEICGAASWLLSVWVVSGEACASSGSRRVVPPKLRNAGTDLFFLVPGETWVLRLPVPFRSRLRGLAVSCWSFR